MPRRARGRPRLPPDKQRKFRVQVAVTWAELARVKRAAEAADMSVSAWARMLVLEAARQAR